MGDVVCGIWDEGDRGMIDSGADGLEERLARALADEIIAQRHPRPADARELARVALDEVRATLSRPTTLMIVKGGRFRDSVQEIWPVLLAASPLGAKESGE